MDYSKKYFKYKKKYLYLKNKKQLGGESNSLQKILEFAKNQFYEEYSIQDKSNESIIYQKITSLPEHKTVSHTPIEQNWKEGATLTQHVQVNQNSFVNIYKTAIQLKKSATNKNFNDILCGLEEKSIQVKFTWSSAFNIVFVNFFSNITDKTSIQYVKNAYEPCTHDGEPIPEAPAYSYNYSTYNKPVPISPYQIISREFTNQIYKWIGRGTIENFRCILDTLTDESELPLRFIYE
jgi:hypothetical protein